MIYPNKNKYLELSKKHNIVPVYKEYMSDTETPTSIFLKTCGLEREGFLLESIEGAKNLSRYSFIGVGFSGRALLEHGIFKYEKDRESFSKNTKKPFDELHRIMSSNSLYKDPDLDHFIGGAVGYLGYDLISYFDDIPLPKGDEGLKLPELYLYFTDLVIVFDHLMNRLKVVSTVKTGKDLDAEKAYSRSVARIENIERKISKNIAPVLSRGLKTSKEGHRIRDVLDSNMTRERFIKNVERAKELITDGEAFQIVLSQRLSTCCDKHPINIYRGLRSINPSPYMYYFDFGTFNIIGASPEPLIKITGDKVLTRPIAGTRKRAISEEKEKNIEESLLSDKKEIAEHNMLVDLARNDLGRVCRYGSVKVEEYMKVEKYSHVMHLVSTVEGQMDRRYGIYDALKSVFPAGTLSGAPKIRAMQIISELEPDRRGPYGGAVGYFGYDGNLDSCITIRTAIVKDGRIYVQAGAGIVYDSIPENEYQETLNKAEALFRALNIIDKANIKR